VQESTKPDRILRLPAASKKVALGRDTIYRKVRAGTFPQPLKLSERASGWLESELDSWIAAQAAKREAP
jgi:prophage regulatory protein